MDLILGITFILVVTTVCYLMRKRINKYLSPKTKFESPKQLLKLCTKAKSDCPHLKNVIIPAQSTGQFLEPETNKKEHKQHR